MQVVYLQKVPAAHAVGAYRVDARRVASCISYKIMTKVITSDQHDLEPC